MCGSWCSCVSVAISLSLWRSEGNRRGRPAARKECARSPMHTPGWKPGISLFGRRSRYHVLASCRQTSRDRADLSRTRLRERVAAHRPTRRSATPRPLRRPIRRLSPCLASFLLGAMRVVLARGRPPTRMTESGPSPPGSVSDDLIAAAAWASPFRSSLSGHGVLLIRTLPERVDDLLPFSLGSTAACSRTSLPTSRLLRRVGESGELLRVTFTIRVPCATSGFE